MSQPRTLGSEYYITVAQKRRALSVQLLQAILTDQMGYRSEVPSVREFSVCVTLHMLTILLPVNKW